MPTAEQFFDEATPKTLTAEQFFDEPESTEPKGRLTALLDYARGLVTASAPAAPAPNAPAAPVAAMPSGPVRVQTDVAQITPSAAAARPMPWGTVPAAPVVDPQMARVDRGLQEIAEASPDLPESRRRIKAPAEPPPSAVVKTGHSLPREVEHALKRGVLRTAESVGTAMRAIGSGGGVPHNVDAEGRVIPPTPTILSPALHEAGKVVEKFWRQKAEPFAMGEDIQGLVWDDPSLLVNPKWLAATIAENVPSLAASLVPGLGAARAIQVGGKAINLTPQVIEKLARIGAPTVGGLSGGMLEGAGAHQAVIAKGGSEAEAAGAWAMMSAAVAGLEAIGLDGMLRAGRTLDPVSATKAARVREVLKVAGKESVTEYLEQPLESVVTGEPITEGLKQGLNVLPAAAASGGGVAAVTSARNRRGAAAPVAEDAPRVDVTTAAPLTAEQFFDGETPAESVTPTSSVSTADLSLGDRRRYRTSGLVAEVAAIDGDTVTIRWPDDRGEAKVPRAAFLRNTDPVAPAEPVDSAATVPGEAPTVEPAAPAPPVAGAPEVAAEPTPTTSVVPPTDAPVPTPVPATPDVSPEVTSDVTQSDEVAPAVPVKAEPDIAPHSPAGAESGVAADAEAIDEPESTALDDVDDDLAATFSPRNPFQLERFIRAQGGIKHDPGGIDRHDYSLIPLRFRRGKGLTLAQMAEMIEEVSGQPFDDDALYEALVNIQGRKRQWREQRRRDAQSEAVPDEVEASSAVDEEPEYETLANDAVTTFQALATAPQESPEWRRAFDLYDWIEEAAEMSGGIAGAKRALLREADDDVAFTPGQRGLPPARLTRADRIALLDYNFPEIAPAPEATDDADTGRDATEGRERQAEPGAPAADDRRAPAREGPEPPAAGPAQVAEARTPYDPGRADDRDADPARDGDADPADVVPAALPEPRASAEPYEYASTQIELPSALSDSILGWARANIPAADRAEGGLEQHHHVTVRYGLRVEGADAVAQALAGTGPVTFRLGRMGLFRQGEQDVLYVAVDSHDLAKLNSALADLPHTDTHPGYVPHVTVAYVKPGRADRFEGSNRFVGGPITADRVSFMPKSGEPTTVSLREFPKRTTDTMSDAIALSSPSGRMSKRAKDAATKRLGEKLFGPGGATREQIMGGPTPQPTERERLLQQAARLRDLADRGMSAKKFRREAEQLEARAAALAEPPTVDDLSAKRAGMPADLKNDINLLADEARWQRAVTTPGERVRHDAEGFEGVVMRGATDPVNGTKLAGRVLVQHALTAAQAERLKDTAGRVTQRWYPALELSPVEAAPAAPPFPSTPAEPATPAAPAAPPEVPLGEQSAESTVSAQDVRPGDVIAREGYPDVVVMSGPLPVTGWQAAGPRLRFRVKAAQAGARVLPHNLDLARGESVRVRRQAADVASSTTPAAPAARPEPRYERTPEGDQALIADTPARAIPPTPLRAERPQRDVDDLPLFGQERDARRRADDEAQGALFEERAPYDAAQQRAAHSAAVVPPFFSALRRALETKMPERAFAPQIRGLLTGAGVKADELSWTGFDDWLTAQGGRKIDKAEALAYLDAHEVQIEEVIKGQPVPPPKARPLPPGYRIRRYRDDDWGLHEPSGALIASGFRSREEVLANLDDILEERGTVAPNNTKFERYTLPGAEPGSYRELLLTLPPKREAMVYPEPLMVLPEGYDPITDFGQPAGRQWGITPPGQMHANPWAGRHATREAAIEAALRRLNEQRNQQYANEWRERNEGSVYRSSHWDEPNVLAHVRFDDRRTADGRRVLHVAEFQSDWAQAGRRHGFTGRRWEVFNPVDGVAQRTFATELEARAYADAHGLDFAQQGVGFSPERDRIPPMPFSKTWHEMAMRRMVRYAAEHGYAAITWDTGAVNADRYDLSKQVSRLLYKQNPDGTYKVSAQTSRSEGIMLGQSIAAEELERHVGKDVAQRIVDGVGPETNIAGNNEPADVWRELSGVDLKVGGEGMRGFYDKILVDYANKLGKKWGARVGDTRVSTGKVLTQHPDGGVDYLDETGYARAWSLPITPAMRASVLTEGQALFERRARYTRRQDADPQAQRQAEQFSRDAVGDLTRVLDAVAPARDVSAGGMPDRGGLAAGRVRELGVGIVRDLADTGHLTLLGQSIHGGDPAALAVLLQPVRSPKFETLRLFTVQGDRVVGEEITSARLPDVTPAPWGFFGTKAQARAWAREYVASAKARGATGFWMAHNHPAGVPNPSDGDREVTRDLRALVGDAAQEAGLTLDFHGHVIIDSGTYAVILPTGDERIESLPGAFLPDPLIRPTVPHPVLGMDITNPLDVARVGAALKTSADYVSLVFTASGSGQVRAVGDLPLSAFADTEPAAEAIRQAAIGYGSGRVFAYYDGGRPDVARAWETARDLVQRGVLSDFVEWTPAGLRNAAMTMPPQATAERDEAFLGRRLDTFRQEHAVREREVPYDVGEIDALAGNLREVERAITDARVGQRVTIGGRTWERTADPVLPWRGDDGSTLATAALLFEARRARSRAVETDPPPPAPPTEPAPAAGTPPPPEGTPLADLRAMRVTPPTLSLTERLRRKKNAAITAAINQFHPVGVALREAGAPDELVGIVMNTLELAGNKVHGQTESFAGALGTIFREATDALGSEGPLALDDYLWLRQMQKRIRDLSSRPDSGVTPEGHRTDAGQERLGGGTGSRYVNPREFDTAKIEQGLAQLRERLGPDQFADVEAWARRVWALNRDILDRAHRAGIVSDETYALLTSRGEDYVPFQVLDFLAHDQATAGPRGQAPMSVRYQSYLKSMEGTERDVRAPLVASLDKAARTLSLVNRNMAAKTALAVAQHVGVAEPVPGDTTSVPGDRDVLHVFEGGERQTYAVPSDVAAALKFLDAAQYQWIHRVLQATSTPLRAGATGANLSFIATNLPRDAKSTLLLFKYGWSPVDFVRGVMSVYRQDDAYKAALESGALFTFQRSVAPESAIRKAAGMTAEPGFGVLKTPGDILRWLMEHTVAITNLAEQGNKMAGVMRAARADIAVNPETQAVVPFVDLPGLSRAAEVANYAGSPNFGRHGAVGPEMNVMMMFYNARVQGSARIYRRVQESPKVAGKLLAFRLLAYSVLPMLALWALNRGYDDDLGLKDIAATERDKYHVLLLPWTYQAADGSTRRAYVKLAKEEMEQALSPAFDAALAWLSGSQTPTATKLATDVLGNLSPVTVHAKGDDPGPQEILTGLGAGVVAGANPLFRLPIELTANWAAYRQSDIVPRGLRERVLPEDQARATTSPIARSVSRALAKTGVSVSPIKLEYAVTSATGGLGQTTLDLIDRLAGKQPAPTAGTYETIARWPVASRLLGTAGNEIDRRTEDRLYEALDRLERTRGSLTLEAERESGPKKRGAKAPPASSARAQEIQAAMSKDDLDRLAKDVRGATAALSDIHKWQGFIARHDALPIAARREALAELAAHRRELLRLVRQGEQATRGFRQPFPAGWEPK